ncbi:MAG: 16S rRNA (guanine(527)-N(7))-methyltransferase RsmG [Candidatus Pelagibacter sp.]|nr:16S rRNA (guanine(527)-N(7))-methyltransferase RsmG [Candidatus Pelagibacter sp.]
MLKTPYLDRIVSRETLNKIEKYCDFLIKYNKKLNLISKSTENIIMSRHIEDSSQLLKYISSEDKNILDIGSGAGFPGIAMYIVKNDLNLDFKLDIVEKSSKKCTYLQELCKFLEIDVVIHNHDVKNLEKKNYTTLVSRAFKPLDSFLHILDMSNIKFNKILLLKGQSYNTELTEAEKHWEIKCDTHDSVTNPGSKVLVINSVKKI